MKENRRREYFGEFNVRFLGYNILKGVTYRGEPIVPPILREGANWREGMYFDVQKLPGASFERVAERTDVPTKRKLEILKHVVGQLKEVDKAGLVLFDRAGRNTMVLSWGVGRGISTRQIDIEEFYDKASGTVYSERSLIAYETYVEDKLGSGMSLWTEAVDLIAEDATKVLKADRAPKSAISVMAQYDDFSYLADKRNIKAGVLNVLERDIDMTLQRLH